MTVYGSQEGVGEGVLASGTGSASLSGMEPVTLEISGKHWTFNSLKDLMGKASPMRSGDVTAGCAASCDEERVAAQMLLADVPLAQFLEEPLIPYEKDEVTRLIVDTHDVAAFAPVKNLSVGAFRDWLLRYETDEQTLAALTPGLTPEMVAAVSKICANQDLILIASKCRVVTAFRDTIGLRGRLSTRLQPNHATDDLKGIAASMLEGLLYGCGDAVIGINPATDSVPMMQELLKLIDELIHRYHIPTQSCVLAHVTNALEVMRAGTPVDLVFQSIAGTEIANGAFGVNLGILQEAYDAALSLKRGTVGQNVMYFETGQGSALSGRGDWGVDMQTCEARAYAVARKFKPLLVNTAGLRQAPCARVRGVAGGHGSRRCASASRQPHRRPACSYRLPARTYPLTRGRPCATSRPHALRWGGRAGACGQSICSASALPTPAMPCMRRSIPRSSTNSSTPPASRTSMYGRSSRTNSTTCPMRLLVEPRRGRTGPRGRRT